MNIGQVIKIKNILLPKQVGGILAATSAVALAVAYIAEYGFGISPAECEGVCIFQRFIYMVIFVFGIFLIMAPERLRGIVTTLKTLIGFVLILSMAHPYIIGDLCMHDHVWSFTGVPVEAWNRAIYGLMLALVVLSFFRKTKSGEEKR